jgi:hypothetical protein
LLLLLYLLGFGGGWVAKRDKMLMLIFGLVGLSSNYALMVKTSRTFISMSSSGVSSIISKTAIQYNPDSDILVRALKGEKVERTPVWLMRQVIF